MRKLRATGLRALCAKYSLFRRANRSASRWLARVDSAAAGNAVPARHISIPPLLAFISTASSRGNGGNRKEKSDLIVWQSGLLKKKRKQRQQPWKIPKYILRRYSFFYVRTKFPKGGMSIRGKNVHGQKVRRRLG